LSPSASPYLRDAGACRAQAAASAAAAAAAATACDDLPVTSGVFPVTGGAVGLLPVGDHPPLAPGICSGQKRTAAAAVGQRISQSVNRERKALRILCVLTIEGFLEVNGGGGHGQQAEQAERKLHLRIAGRSNHVRTSLTIAIKLPKSSQGVRKACGHRPKLLCWHLGCPAIEGVDVVQSHHGHR
jgi:hypothetical protein